MGVNYQYLIKQFQWLSMPLQLDYSQIVTALFIPVMIEVPLLLVAMFVNKQLTRQIVNYSGTILMTMILTGVIIYLILQLQINGINSHYESIGATETALTNIQGNIQATATSLEATLLPSKIETAVAATMQAAQIPTATAP